MTLIAILIGTIAAGVGSVWLAAALGFAMLARYTQHMLSLAAGALMGTAFLHLLPEAFESQASAQELFAMLLGGVVFFFLLDKAELWHHGHEHHHAEVDGVKQGAHSHAGHDHADAHSHHNHHDHHGGHHHGPRSGGWAVLAGDSVHAFGDG
ncbi:MAG TPA: ZIP family metal transporter, partial [Hydrogenophaga sp.]